VHLHPEKARAAIRAGAAEAIRRAPRLAAYTPPPPVRFDVDLVSPHLTDLAALIPTVTRSGPRTVTWEAPDMLAAFMTWRAVLNVVLARVAV